jgi:hypothetical protein
MSRPKAKRHTRLKKPAAVTSVDIAETAPAALTVVKSPPTSQGMPRHHIDKRAQRLVADNDGDDDDLMTTEATAEWLEVSREWLEIGRKKGYGPPYTRLAERLIRYKRSDVLAWLRTRVHRKTSEYATA